MKAFSPGSVTLFFEIKDEHRIPERRGSRGVGICVSRGVVTEVYPAEGLEVQINGRVAKDSIQELVAKSMGFSGRIESIVELPVSHGFGMSAAAALSTALAIAGHQGKTYLEGARIAHLAEIQMHSGLGDVASQYEGGATLRLREGIQPYGIVDRLPVNEKILLVIFEGEMRTSKVLEDREWKKKIKKEGHRAMEKFLKEPTLSNAVKIGRDFSFRTKLVSEEVKNFIEECKNAAPCLIGNAAIVVGHCKESILEEYHVIPVEIGSRASLLHEKF